MTNPLAVVDRFLQSTVDQVSQLLWGWGLPRYLQIYALNVALALVFLARAITEDDVWWWTSSVLFAVVAEYNRRDDARCEGTDTSSPADHRRQRLGHWVWRGFIVMVMPWAITHPGDAITILVGASWGILLLESYVINAPRTPPRARDRQPTHLRPARNTA